MTDYASHFPTYLEWLAAHPDDALTEYFNRVVTTIAPTELPLSHELPVHSEHALDALLTHTTGTQLAILHAASELDAARTPATVADFTDTLAELFDIAGTPRDEIPSTAEFATAAAGLVHLGLLYSPAVNLAQDIDQIAAEWQPDATFAVPPHVPGAFNPATEHLWRLVDAHRNPLSMIDLMNLYREQTDRQRSVLHMLHANGGVGHSAAFQPGADPDHPLAQMLAAGLLDRLDDTTVRVTGRLQVLLKRVAPSPPGGVWTTRNPTEPNHNEPEEHPTDPHPTDPHLVPRTVQLITDVCDALEDLATHPITPLNRGGIGIREIKKIATRRGITEELASMQLTFLLETKLLALGETTPRFEGSVEPFFAITEAALDFLESDLATQWAQLISNWLTSDYAPWLVDGSDVRIGQKEAYSPLAARLRELWPKLSTGEEMETLLWRLRPALAWQTSVEVWDDLLAESRQVGFAAAGAHAGELSTSELAQHLAAELPDPVDYLIVQSDHTILAPGPLRADDAHMLAAFAEKESSGMATVWRVTTDSLRHGFSRGLGSAAIVEFLSRMSPTPLPQSLTYVVEDTWRGPGVASNKTETTYRVDTPQPPTPRVPDMLEYIGAYRDWLAEQDSAGLASAATDPGEITELLRTAAETRQMVDVSMADADGRPITVSGHVIAVSPTLFSIIDATSGNPISVHPHRLISATTRVE